MTIPNHPDPADYGICSRHGFLSPTAPLTHLQDSYYESWDTIIPRLSGLIADGTLPDEIRNLPLLDTHRLQDEPEQRRAYVILAFLIHGYVWCQSPPNQIVPPQLTEPFLSVCCHLGLKPVLSYTGLCSWKWQIRGGGDMALDDIDPLASFTGTRGEAAFYHVPVLIEAEGGHLVRLMLDAMDAAQHGRIEFIVEALRTTTETLACMGEHLSKLYAVLDPNFLYHDLRPFFAGGSGMEDKGLPQGIVFQRSDGTTLPLKLAGGSAAQSSLFHFIDLALGIEHGDRTVFDEMRGYMPGAHRNFLAAVTRLPSLRSFIEARPSDVELLDAYNDCVQCLRSWRKKHIAIVSRYIVRPAREAEPIVPKETLTKSDSGNAAEQAELRGTGGTSLVTFLQEARDDTKGVSTVRACSSKG